MNLFTLMYADDKVLFSISNHIKGLQNLLDKFNDYCIALKLSVNVAKSKSGFFGGIFREKNLEIVNSFTYLGIDFNLNNKFAKAEKQLDVQGRKATFFLIKKKC